MLGQPSSVRTQLWLLALHSQADQWPTSTLAEVKFRLAAGAAQPGRPVADKYTG